jgi:glycosyltransferase involved in cell wall biosynthesis
MSDVSVVIPVRSDPRLAKAIASTPADVDVIVAFTDPPPSFVETLATLAENRNLRWAISPRRGMAAGVNLGTELALHDKVVILDSDCVLEKGALGAYSRALECHAFVRGVTLVERDGFWSRLSALGTERLNRVFQDQPRLFGPAIAFRKNEFLTRGGYDVNMVRGSCDHEFAYRLEREATPVHFEREAVVVHQPITFRIDTRSHVGYGHGSRYMDEKFGGWYGLRYCLNRFSLRGLFRRAVERGGLSVLRALLLGVLMLWGYLRQALRGRRVA